MERKKTLWAPLGLRLPGRIDGGFALLFMVMLATAAGNTAMQSILPAFGRSIGVADSAVGAAFSVSALLWVFAAPYWANRSDRRGRRAMILLGTLGFAVSQLLCGVFLALGLNGWLGPAATFLAFVFGRLIYGAFGAAAPPAAQAMVANSTPPGERTRALALLASAFGLGTVIGPAVAPYFVMGDLWPGGPEIGLAGPAFAFALFALALWLTCLRHLPRDEWEEGRGAAVSYPSIGGQATGASVTAATAPPAAPVGYLDTRIRAWLIVGVVVGHAQAMTGQAIGFLIIDRLHLEPVAAVSVTGMVLMGGAVSSLAAQWGLIPLFNPGPRALVLWGAVTGAAGCLVVAWAMSAWLIMAGYALLCLGIGFARPGYTAGASLAVGSALQGSVAGKVTSVNGAGYVLGPSIGVALYELSPPLPYVVAAAGLVLLLAYCRFRIPLRPADATSPAQ